MRKLKRLANLLLLAGLAARESSVVALAEETNTITFPDPHLEQVVREALPNTDGPITSQDMARLTRLYAGGRQIANLSGLETAMNLTVLYIADNPVADLSPLAGLTNLADLSLGSNPMTDYSAISNLTGLSSLALRTGLLRDLRLLQPLTKLQSLTLFENGIQEVSPLSALTNLSYLDVRRNWLTNCSALTNLPRLASLYLGGNRLTTIPNLQALPRLSLLNLEANGISDLSPLSELTNLKYLSLSQNPLTNAAVLSRLTGLENLELRGNSLNEVGFLSPLGHLSYLDLAYNRVTDLAPLTNLPALRSLVLTGNFLSAPTELSALTNVSNLWLSDCSLSQAEVLTNLTWLNYLDLQNTGISNLAPILSLSQLTGLAVGHNPVADISGLSQLTNLTTLHLAHIHTNGTHQVVPSGLNDLSPLSGLRRLTFLALNHNCISNLAPLKGLTNLLDLDLRRNPLPEPGVQANLLQGIQLAYLTTNPLPLLSTPLTTDWYVPAAGKGTLELHVAEPNAPEAEFTVHAASSNPALLAENPVAGTNGQFQLTVTNTLNEGATLQLRLSVSDDVGSSTGTNITVHVIAGGAEAVATRCPASLSNALTQIGWQLGKAGTNVTVVDLLTLTHLRLWNVELAEEGDCMWQYLANLKSLELTGGSVSNPACLANLTNLNVLTLTDTLLGDVQGVLAGLPELTSLSLSGAGLTNVCSLQEATSLTNLTLARNRLTDIACLATLTKLTSLDLRQNLLTNITSLTNLPHLSTVDLRYNLLDTGNPAVNAAIEILTNRGVLVSNSPQRAPPSLHLPANPIVAAGWTNKLSFYVTENDALCSGDQIEIAWNSESPDLLSNAQAWRSFTNTSPDWAKWCLYIAPSANQSGTAKVALWATNDAGLVGSTSMWVTITPPLSLTNRVLVSTNISWRTSPQAPWFGQSVVTHFDGPAGQSGSVGGAETSWLEAEVDGPGLLTFWWRVSSGLDSSMLEYFSPWRTNDISGEVDWQQQQIRIPAGTNTVTWLYVKSASSLVAGRDAAWLADVSFSPLGPRLPAQTAQVVNQFNWLRVTNTATDNAFVSQWVTNDFSFTYSNREALLGDGWSFIAQTHGANRDTEITNPAAGSLVDYDQSSHPGVLRIPCGMGDLWEDSNSSQNSLFRNLPTNWVSLQLALSFTPSTNYQQMQFGLYQDDDNYLELGVSYNSLEFEPEEKAVTLTLELNGSPTTLRSLVTATTNFYFRFDGGLADGSVTTSWSPDGTNWTQLRTVTPGLVASNLVIWTGGSPSDKPAELPSLDLRQFAIVTNRLVPSTLTYSLLNAPSGAAIDTNGLITWFPDQGQALSTNITCVVTDNSVPPLSATNHFEVVVNAVPIPPLSVEPAGDVFTIGWKSVPGQTYRLQYKNDLSETNWRDFLPEIVATNAQTITTNPISGNGSRFFRLIVVP